MSVIADSGENIGSENDNPKEILMGPSKTKTSIMILQVILCGLKLIEIIFY